MKWEILSQKYRPNPEWTPKIMKNSAIDSFFNSASDPGVGGKFWWAILVEKNDFKSPKMATQGLPTSMDP